MGRLRYPRYRLGGDKGARKMRSNLWPRAARDVADPEPRLEAAALVEPMHARIPSAALQQDVVTIPDPGGRKRRAHNGPPMALASKPGVADHTFEKGVPPSPTQQIRRRNEHAGRYTIRISTVDTNTATLLLDRVSSQICSARAIGSALRLTSEARNSSSSEARSVVWASLALGIWKTRS